MADGEGGFTADTLGNYAGTLIPEVFEGTYALNARCTLELRYSHEGEDSLIVGYLAGHGDSFTAMVAVPGWAVSGSLRKKQ